LSCGDYIIATPPSVKAAWKANSERHLDLLTAFGLFAVTAMLIFYALEDHSPWFVLAFAGACALGSIYGFLQGAWPFGLVEAVWSVIAIRRWRTRASVSV